MEEAF